MSSKVTVADALVRRLRDHGVAHVFGYPGGQITPLYDALYREGTIRHVLAREEQAAAFMADGYARATGKVGVSLAVCGPGVLNAATPLAEAFTDSVPILVISGQVRTPGLGLRSGYYHENDQLKACTTFTKWQGRVSSADEIISQVDVAFSAMTDGRPGPVILEVPLDILASETEKAQFPKPPPRLPGPEPEPGRIEELAKLLSSWKKPLILAGGGVIAAGAEKLLVSVAERLGAPVITTLMGKCAIPSDHPLAAGNTWHGATSDVSNMEQYISPFFTQADGLLAIGCRFSQVSTGSWALKVPPALAHIDIDPAEIGRHYPVTLGITADAGLALEKLLAALPGKENRPSWAPMTATRVFWRLPKVELIRALRETLPPDAIVAADVTRLGYMMLVDFPVYRPRTFLHPAGFVAMGHGIPAALGAKAAFPERTVVAVVGDGCFMMSGMELATAVQEKLPIIVVLVNDSCLTLIKAIQERRFDRHYLGVDLENPDFGQFAKAFGVRAWQVDSDAAFGVALQAAVKQGETALIEVRVPTGVREKGT